MPLSFFAWLSGTGHFQLIVHFSSHSLKERELGYAQVDASSLEKD